MFRFRRGRLNDALYHREKRRGASIRAGGKLGGAEADQFVPADDQGTSARKDGVGHIERDIEGLHALAGLRFKEDRLRLWAF